MPVIITTQEAEIRRIKVQSQPEQIILQDSISKIPNTKMGWQSGSVSHLLTCYLASVRP
jgi:hypothetical protein